MSEKSLPDSLNQSTEKNSSSEVQKENRLRDVFCRHEKVDPKTVPYTKDPRFNLLLKKHLHKKEKV